MAKPANKKRGEVALPEAGEGAFLRFDTDALERLEGEYGEDYLDIILKGLSKARPTVFKTVTKTGLNGADASAFPWGLAYETMELRIRDALYLMIHGRTFEEQRKHEEDLEDKRWEEIEKNPRRRQALFSMLAAEQGTEPVSAPTNSGA